MSTTSASTVGASWNTTNGGWFTAANWDEPNPNPPPPTLHYVPHAGNDVSIPNNASGGALVTITYNGTDTVNTLNGAGNVLLKLNAGSLTVLNGGGFDDLSLASGATFDIGGGTETFARGSFTGTVSGDGTLRFVDGAFSINAGVALNVANWLLDYRIGSGTTSITTLNTDLTYAHNFTIDSPLGNPAYLLLNSHTLTLSGTAFIGGDIDGAGTLKLTGSSTIDGAGIGDDPTSGFAAANAATLENANVVSQTGGIALNGEILNDAGATWTFADASGISNQGATFVNSGALEDVASGNSEIDGAFVNSGSVSISSGATFILAQGAETLGGSVSGGGTLAFGFAHDATLDTASLTVASVYINGGNGGGTVALGEDLTYGGAFTFTDGFGFLDLDGHTLQLAGSAAVTGGSVDGAGSIKVTSGGTATVGFINFGDDPTSGFDPANAATLENAGSVGQVGFVSLNGEILNDAGATWTFSSAVGVGNEGATFVNNGAVQVLASGNSEIDGTFVNSGAVAISSGASLILAGGPETLGGTVSGAGTLVLGFAHDATLDPTSLTVSSVYINGGNGGGTVTLGQNLTYGGDFTFSDQFGLLDLDGHALTLTGSAALTGGAVDGPGTIKVTSGAAATVGYINVGDDPTSGFDPANSATLTNAGSVSQVGFIALNGEILNSAGATWTFNSATGVANRGATFINKGILQDVASGNSEIDGTLVNSGSLEIGSGAALVLAGGAETLAGRITGGGELVLGFAHDTTLNPISLTVSSIYVNGGNGGGEVTLGKNLTYGGAFTFTDGFGGFDLNGHTLALSGSAALTAGSIDGPGSIKVAKAGSATIGFIAIGYDPTSGFDPANAVTLENVGKVSQIGGINLNGEILNDAGATWKFTSAASVNNIGASFVNRGVLSDLAAGQSQINGAFTNSSTVFISKGTTLALGGGAETLQGKVVGGGVLLLDGGGAVMLDTMSLTVSTISAVNDTVTLGETLSYGGQLDISDQLDLAGHTLTAAGSAAFEYATIGGHGVVKTTGSTTIGAVTIGDDGSGAFGSANSAGFQNSGALTQVGDISLDGAITNASGASWTIASASTLHDRGASFVNKGALEDAAMGESVIQGAFTNSGTVEVLSGATLEIVSGRSYGEALVDAGGMLVDLAVTSGGVLVDNGAAVYGQQTSTILAGGLSGSGQLVENGPGVLVVSGVASGFTGETVISGGTVEFATSGAVGSGSIDFAANGGASAVLALTKAAQPKEGATFGEVLSDFSSSSDALDFTGQAFVSGATAVVKNSVLTVKDGGYLAHFTLAGAVASSYQASADSAGHLLVTPVESAAMAMTQAMASFGEGEAPNGVRPVSSGCAGSSLIANPSAGQSLSGHP